MLGTFDKIFIERVYQILETDDDQELRQRIVESLINQGRQSLKELKDYIPGRIFQEQIASSSSALFSLLVQQFEQQLFNYGDEWFRHFLEEQKEESHILFNQIVQSLAEKGLQSLRDHVYLSLTIPFLFENMNIDPVWQSLTTYGLEGLDRHQDEISPSLLQEQRYNCNSVLYLSLNNYFRIKLNELFQRSGLRFNQSELFDIILDSVVRCGLWKGLHENTIRRSLGDRFDILILHIIDDEWANPIETNEFRIISHCFNENQQMGLSTLLSAGELIYMNKNFSNIIADLITQYREKSDFPAFLRECLIPIMYLLKRQYNLNEFVGTFRIQCDESNLSLIPLSLRLLIDFLLENADYSLSRKVVSLLNERNPVPFVQPSNRFVSDVIHVWNSSSPTILSFGIGKCSGKSFFLNRIFLTSFEERVSSIYFRNTIDIDFGLSCHPRRSCNIADAHGSICQFLLKKISSLFDGFFIHVNYKFLTTNPHIVRHYLNLIPVEDKYHLLIVRDVQENEKQSCKNFLSSTFPSIKTEILPDISDTNHRDVVFTLGTLTRNLLEQLPKRPVEGPKFIHKRLRELMNDNYREHLDQLEQTINELETSLIRIAENKTLVPTYFPKYLKFVDLCQFKLKMIHCHFFEKNNHEDAIVDDLVLQTNNAKENFRRVEQQLSGIFELFWKLLKTPKMITSLEFLGTRLKQGRTRFVKNGEMATDIPIEKSLSLEVLWRDAIISSEYRLTSMQNDLQEFYYQYIQNGFPFEIIDGDNFFFQHSFLRKSLTKFPQKRLLVISIIGPQNSGKSTLFNYMFGSLFDVRDGRCTRGIYGSLMKSNCSEFDQILLIDTEGLLSIEREDPEFDRQIFLFCLALSHIVIVNVDGEISSTVQTLLTLSIDSLSKMGVTRMNRPMVHFVFNKKANTNLDNNKAAIQLVLDDLKKRNLDQLIRMDLESFHALPAAFQTGREKFGQSKLRETVPDFLEGVQNLGAKIIESAQIYFQQSIQTWTILQWLSLVSIIFETLHQFPHLTRYRHVDHRTIDTKLRFLIQNTLKDICLSKFTDAPTDDLQQVYAVRLNRIQDQQRDEFERSLISSQASDDSRDRLKNYLDIQLKQVFDAFQRSAVIQRYTGLVRAFIQNGNDDLRQLIIRQVDATEFDRSFDSIIETFKQKLRFGETLRDSMKFIYSSYNLYESNCLLEFTYLIHHLSMLHQIPTTINEHKEIFLQYFIRLGYQYCPVQMDELSFDVTSITPVWTNSFKYLDKNLLKRDLQQLNSSSNENTEQDQQRWTRRFRNLFSVFSQSNETKIPLEYRYDIRRELQEQRLTVATNSTAINDKQIYLPMRNIFEELLQRLIQINEEFNVEQIRLEIIPKVIDSIGELIKEIENELRPFSLMISHQLKSSLHTCALLFLTKLYHNRQYQQIQKILSPLSESRNSMRKFYLDRIESNRLQDEESSRQFAQRFCQDLEISYRLNINQIIDQQIVQNDHFNRNYIQKQCDERLWSLSDRTWCLNYLRDPIHAIVEEFCKSWSNHLQTSIHTQCIDQKSRYVTLMEEFFECVQTFSEGIDRIGDSSLVINDMFVTESDNTYSIYENFLNKKLCFVRVFSQYLAGSEIRQSFIIDRTAYTIKNDYFNDLVLFLKRREPSTSLSIFNKKISGCYTSVIISHPKAFFNSLLEQKAKLIDFCRQLPSDFASFDTEDIYNRVLKRVKGCSELCPCCNRPCDVNHNELLSFLTEQLTKHACYNGHGLHAITGQKFGKTNDASLWMCDLIEYGTNIVINGTSHSWDLYQLLNSNWTFQSKLNEEQLQRSRSRWLCVWASLGKEICQQNGLKYVTCNF